MSLLELSSAEALTALNWVYFAMLVDVVLFILVHMLDETPVVRIMQALLLGLALLLCGIWGILYAVSMLVM